MNKKQIKALSFAVAFGCYSYANAKEPIWMVPMGEPDPDVVIYFDAESVIKNNDTITLGLQLFFKKSDKIRKFPPVSTYEIGCNKKTGETLHIKYHDEFGKVINEVTVDFGPNKIAPESYMSYLLTIFCAPDFPSDKSGKYYKLVPNNDPFAFTKQLSETNEKNK